jgi:NAD(P)H dehydrogenase (quinone)
MAETFLITGATGKTSELVSAALRHQGATVRALVRDVTKAAALSERGVQISHGDFDKPDTLARALDGVTSVSLVTPPNPGDAGMVARFLDVAVKSPTAPRIVRLSAIMATEGGPTDSTRNHGGADRAILESGLAYAILRPNYFMQNLFGSAESILTGGKLVHSMGDGRIGFIDVRDIADVAAAVLLDRGWDHGIYDLTGPASVSFHDVARDLGDALGREVTCAPITPEQARESALQKGWGEWGAGLIAGYATAYAKGWGDFTTSFVQKITGHEARSVGQFAREVFTPALNRGSSSGSIS